MYKQVGEGRLKNATFFLLWTIFRVMKRNSVPIFLRLQVNPFAGGSKRRFIDTQQFCQNKNRELLCRRSKRGGKKAKSGNLFGYSIIFLINSRLSLKIQPYFI